jgi:hypothetical protein
MALRRLQLSQQALLALSHESKVQRRRFQPEEDALLTRIMSEEPALGWDAVAKRLAGRNARQCRERWLHYLSPQVRTGPWTPAEEAFLIALMNEHGHSWSVIRQRFNGRGENDIKNRWYSHLQYEAVLCDGRLMLARDLPFRTVRWARPKRRQRVRDPKKVLMQLIEHGLPQVDVSNVCVGSTGGTNRTNAAEVSGATPSGETKWHDWQERTGGTEGSEFDELEMTEAWEWV